MISCFEEIVSAWNAAAARHHSRISRVSKTPLADLKREMAEQCSSNSSRSHLPWYQCRGTNWWLCCEISYASCRTAQSGWMCVHGAFTSCCFTFGCPSPFTRGCLIFSHLYTMLKRHTRQSWNVTYECSAYRPVKRLIIP